MNNDLELFTSDELLTELQTRFDHIVFCGMKNVTDDNDVTDLRWSGSLVACAGILQYATHKIMQVFDETRLAGDEEGTEVDE